MDANIAGAGGLEPEDCGRGRSWSEIQRERAGAGLRTVPRRALGYCFVSRDNLQIKRASVLGVNPTQQDF